MTNETFAFAPFSAAPIAVPADPSTAVLDEMMARVGVDGLVAAFRDPGVLALVDQHTAAVRDALADAGRELAIDGLASYARSIVAAARRSNRVVPEPGWAPRTAAEWRAADWHLLRLVAVCALAVEFRLI
jgi:hypothetical protein